jgi:hypothetical protein
MARGIKQVSEDSLPEQLVLRKLRELEHPLIDVDDFAILGDDDSLGGRIGQFIQSYRRFTRRLSIDQSCGQGRKNHQRRASRHGKRHHRIVHEGGVDNDRGVGRDDRRAHRGEMQGADRDR